MIVDPRTLVRLALAAVLLAVISHTRADPDLWGHVRFGGDILAARAIPAADTYSFLSDKPWTNHEWLAECAAALAYAIGGGPGLAALKFLVVLATLALIWFELRRQALHPSSIDLLLALAIVGTFPQANHVRPQVFSLIAFACLVVCLLRAANAQADARHAQTEARALPIWRTSSRRWLLVIPLIFAVWVNLHGGWIVGGGVLAVWAVLSLGPASTRSEGLLLLLAGVASLLATLINPYGWHMWEFLSTTVGFGRAEITDWQPVYRLGLQYVALWLLLAVVASAAVIRAWRSGQWEIRRLAVLVLLGAGSFRVSRLLAFFAIAIVLLAGRDLAGALHDRRARASARAASPTPRLTPARYAIAAVLVAAVLIAGGGAMTVRNLSCVRFANDQPEPDVVPLVQNQQLRGRLVVWFDWGEYAIWHLAPALLVSIDGRRETIYSDQVMQKHLAFYYAAAPGSAFLDEVRADHVWLPADLPVVNGLLADGWQPVYRGPRSVWLTRGAGARGVSGSSGAAAVESGLGARCFPGP